MTDMSGHTLDPTLLSVVVPVFNEVDNIGALLEEIQTALHGLGPFEIIVVDDASTDGTEALLATMMERFPRLVVARHARNLGQSAALCTGVDLACSAWVATLDGDGQNDPADLPRLISERDRLGPSVKLVTGWRQTRRDSWRKRVGSRIANFVRAAVLGDATPDTGCGIKLFEREAFHALPRFDHMHRFIPALIQREGWQTASVVVNHRPRNAGISKYSNIQRLLVGLPDLVGVAWLLRRRCRSDTQHVLRADYPVQTAHTGGDHGR